MEVTGCGGGTAPQSNGCFWVNAVVGEGSVFVEFGIVEEELLVDLVDACFVVDGLAEEVDRGAR